jgi:hypothetical protein
MKIMQRRTQRHRPAGRRRGAVLVIAMMCVLLSSFLVVQVARLAVMTRDRHRIAHQSLQADWLAASAAQRAVTRLQADPAYAGETWMVSADELDGSAAGEVTIAVSGGEVVITAEFPAGSPTGARRSMSIALSAGNPAVAE